MSVIVLDEYLSVEVPVGAPLCRNCDNTSVDEDHRCRRCAECERCGVERFDESHTPGVWAVVLHMAPGGSFVGGRWVCADCCAA